jgi:hypothetical protein
LLRETRNHQQNVETARTSTDVVFSGSPIFDCICQGRNVVENVGVRWNRPASTESIRFISASRGWEDGGGSPQKTITRIIHILTCISISITIIRIRIRIRRKGIVLRFILEQRC